VTAPAVPDWSVVVPTFNRPQRLSNCVAALIAMQPPNGGFEIIIVNDGGTEPPDTLRATPANANLLFVTQTHAGPASARNSGAQHARGKWLAFTDDDCAPEPDWLIALERAVRAAPDSLVGGTVLNALQDNLFSETSQRLAQFTAMYFDGTGGRERFFTSNNIALARAEFLAAGGFHTGFGDGAGEDREFCDRWHAQERPSRFEPRAVVHHAHDLSLISFLRQHYAYGRGARSFRAVRQAGARPVRIDPAFYLGSFRHAWQNQPAWRGAATTVLMAAAHAAYGAGLAQATLRSGGASRPMASE
jgi:glycosyltransferase involved in cell wall biosynthesis